LVGPRKFDLKTLPLVLVVDRSGNVIYKESPPDPKELASVVAGAVGG
jgi:hypothetical protein